MRRTAARVLGALALVFAGQAAAQDYRYHVFIDRDVSNSTGCSQVVGAETISGAEERLTANVTGTNVTSVTRASCAGGSFGAEQGIGGPHPVGLNNGTAGGDVIELSVVRDALGANGAARLSVSGENGSGTAADVLAAQPGGGPILIDLFRAAIPTLGVFGLLLLVGALLFVASRKLKFGLASLGALLVAGAVWAANFVTDGQVGDWAGQSALATDANGDATGTDPGAELLAFFGAEENGRVFFRIDVADVENQVPVPQAQNLSIAEDSGAQAITLVATDGDGDPITYAIASNPTKGVLSGFNAATGAVTYTPNADAEGADSFSFTASDGLATSAPATISITLTPVNDAPVAQDATFSVPENSPNGTNVGTPVVATDVDTTAPNNTLSYAITAGNTDGAFAINAASGQITVANSAALDFKTNPSFSLSVTVSDGGAPSLSDIATITINLGNLNEPPVFQGEPYAFSLPENSAVATVVGSVPALDPDTTAPNNTLTYAITSGNASGAFAIDAATGQITVANSAPLNFETTPSFTLGVSVTDGGTPQGSDTSTVTINLTDVNEAPTVTGGTFTLAENSANGTPVATPTATDPDLPTQNFSWAITAGNTGGAFSINPSTGAMNVANAGALDFETNPVFTLTVEVTDSGVPAQSGSATVTVNLSNVNEPPLFTGEPYAGTVGQSAPNGTPVVTVSAVDVDTGDVLSFAITGGNGTGSGAFAINPTSGVISVADNAQLGGAYTLAISVTDNGTPALSDTSTVAISVDEPPQATVNPAAGATVASNNNITVTFNETVTLSGAWFALNCASSGNRVSTGELSGTGITIIENTPDLVYTIDPTADFAAGEACVVTIAAANVADNDTIDPPNNPAADAVVNFSVDAAPGVASTTPANGASNVSVGANLVVDFDEPVTIGSAAAFSLECPSGLPIGFTVTSPATLPATATSFTIDPAADLPTTSACTLTVVAAQVVDGDAIDPPDNMAANHVVSFTTTDPAPTVTSTLPIDGGNLAANADIVINFSEAVNFTDASFTLACPGATAFVSSGSGSNTATLNPAANLPVGATCTVTVLAAGVSDVDAVDPPDTMAANHVFSFTPVNTPPTLTAGAALNYTEDDPATAIDTTITVTDPDTATLSGATAQITGGYVNGEDVLDFVNTPNITGSFSAATGTLTLAGVDSLANYQAALRAVTYTNLSNTPNTSARTVSWIGNDGIANSIAVTSTINVSAADDGPTAVADSATVSEDSGANAINVLANDTDVDGGPISISAVTQPTNGVVVITGGGTGLTYAPNANYCNAPPGTTPDTFTYTLTPGGSVATVSVTVSCTNDAPVANLGSATTNEDTQVVVLLSGSDIDGDPLTFSIVTPPTQGSTGAVTQLTPTTASVTYMPNANFNGADSFTFRVNDGSGNSPAATVTINVIAVDDPPVAVADAATVAEDSGATAVPVLTNDTDPDAGPISITGVTQPTNGVVAITGGGTGLTYAPNLNYCNNPPGTTPDTFTYTLTPGGSSATVSMTVTCVNDPPVADDETYQFIGNTELRVALAAGTTPNTPTGPGVLDGDNDPIENDGLTVTAITVGACTDASVPLDCSDPAVGRVTMNADGSFSFFPEPGDSSASETFTYVVTDNGVPTPASDTGSVTMTRFDRVWYVKNDAPAGGNGTSATPFDTLAEAQAASLANDTIFVHFGNGTSSGMTAGIALKNGQRLIGEHLGLSMPVAVNGGPNPTPLVTAVPGNRPLIDGINAVSATDALPLFIGGLSLNGSTDALDLTTAAAFAGTGSLEIRDNIVRGGGTTGFDINLQGTAGVNLSLHDNTFNAGANAIDIDETGTGSLTITAFDDNVVNGNVTGNGIAIDNAIFDATPGGSYQVVSGGVTTIGAAGNGVGGAGVVLTTVSGDLAFTDLDIYAGNGAGLSVSGTGVIAASTGTRVTVGAGVGVVEATGGPALNLSGLTADLQLTSLRSTNSTTNGVALTNVADGTSAATVSAGAASTISNATGTDFVIDGGNATVTYAGTITDTSGQAVSIVNTSGNTKTFSGAISHSGGAGVLMNANTGSTMNFSGGLNISSGTASAFAATGGGTVNVTGTANTLASTTGVALNVANTTIGASDLNFRSVSANGASSGIVLNNTGTLGGLSVTGTGTAGSGGTIQNTTSHGITLATTIEPSFINMSILNAAGDGVHGTEVNGFTFSNGSIDNTGTGGAAQSANIGFNNTAAGTERNLHGVVTISGNTLTNSRYHGVDIFNFNGTISDLDVSGNTITSATSTASSLGSAIRVIAYGSASTVANVTTADLNNNIISNFPSAAGIMAQAGNANAAGSAGVFGTAGSPTNIINITGNRIAGLSALNRIGTNAIVTAVNGRGQGNFNISNNGTVANPITHVTGTALSVSSFGEANVTATVSNNVIVANNTVASQGIGFGTSNTTGFANTPQLGITISGNNISATDGNGILGVARDGSGTLRAKIQNNTVAAPLTGVRPGIRVDAGNGASVDDSVCVNISGNTSAGSGGSQGIGLRKQGTVATTNDFGVHGMAAATASPGVENYVAGLNPAGNGVLLISATSGFSNCNLP